MPRPITSKTWRADNGIKREKAQLFAEILRNEAIRIFPDGPVADEAKADAVLRPSLRLNDAGTKLVIERFNGKELLSVIEVNELESLGPDAYSRVVSRSLRDIVYGRFQKPVATVKAKTTVATVGVN